MFLVLQGRFLNTGPPGMPSYFLILHILTVCKLYVETHWSFLLDCLQLLFLLPIILFPLGNYIHICSSLRSSLIAQLVKNPPATQETWVQSLGWEDPLEKERLPTPVFWSGEFHDCIVHGVAKLDTTEQLSLSYSSLSFRSQRPSEFSLSKMVSFYPGTIPVLYFSL